MCGVRTNLPGERNSAVEAALISEIPPILRAQIIFTNRMNSTHTAGANHLNKPDELRPYCGRKSSLQTG
jgi:hypothetical protein